MEGRNIIHSIKWKRAYWIGHILHRKYLPKHIIDGNIEGRIED
jgi:hypothetical protein